MPRLERIELCDGVHRGVLHEIARVEMPAGRGGQPPVRPSLERRQAPLQNRVDGRRVAASRADDQLDRRLVAEQSRRVVEWVFGHVFWIVAYQYEKRAPICSWRGGPACVNWPKVGCPADG